MSRVPPPNPALVELAAILGDDDVRTLVRLFLAEFPAALRAIASSGRDDARRLAHSQKSTARLMGAPALAEKMAALEQRLTAPGATLTAAELAAATGEFERAAAALRKYAK